MISSALQAKEIFVNSKDLGDDCESLRGVCDREKKEWIFEQLCISRQERRLVLFDFDWGGHDAPKVKLVPRGAWTSYLPAICSGHWMHGSSEIMHRSGSIFKENVEEEAGKRRRRIYCVIANDNYKKPEYRSDKESMLKAMIKLAPAVYTSTMSEDRMMKLLLLIKQRYSEEKKEKAEGLFDLE